ncbi:hypothetical protein [Microbacterium soli]|uniref:Uncharacterized protein n=1 Tax=Microbacterium soli TaxID=446075 RepID=A0ABP7MZH3_9MICO
MSRTHALARPGAPFHDRPDDGRPETPQTGAPELAWRQADEDVFVATAGGEFAGFVTVESNTHVAHDRHSRRIGSYPTLAAARQALADATRPPSRRLQRLHRRIIARRR